MMRVSHRIRRRAWERRSATGVEGRWAGVYLHVEDGPGCVHPGVRACYVDYERLSGSGAEAEVGLVIAFEGVAAAEFVGPSGGDGAFLVAPGVVEEDGAGLREVTAHDGHQAVAPTRGVARRAVADDEIDVVGHALAGRVVPGEVAVVAEWRDAEFDGVDAVVLEGVADASAPAFVVLEGPERSTAALGDGADEEGGEP
jgi:hypothetical protein